MSRRTDTIRNLFAQKPAEALSADNRSNEAPRVAAGAVRSIKDTFSAVERENADLRARLDRAEQVVEVAPDSIDPSPFADRFSEDDDSDFETLKRSIEERGQEVPILLRPHPALADRYEVAYGHRRVRAARALSKSVKAIVRSLSDDDLVVAQGLENSAREDLSFIERAVFAHRLENSGKARSVIQQALAVDKAEASKLISVARLVPEDVVRAIGKAPKTGRPRWQAFAEGLQENQSADHVRQMIVDEKFRSASSDERFALAYASAMGVRKEAPITRFVSHVTDASGVAVAQISASKREIRVALSKPAAKDFAAFLAKQLPRLLKEFDETGSEAT